MKLVELLERLSSEERDEVVRRRLREESVPYENHALADLLSRRREVEGVLIELNAFQNLILRWLAEKPSLEAPWGHLLQDLADRVPQDYLGTELDDLRLWGLIDYSPSPDNGFIATYPAVATAVSGDIIRLRDILPRMDMHLLQRMCRAAGHPRPPKRKSECVGLLAWTLSQPAFISNQVASLSDTAGGLFQWIQQNGGRGSRQAMLTRLTAGQPEVRMASLHPAYIPHVQTRDDAPLSELMIRCLVVPVFAYEEYSSWSMPSFFAVPEEVEQALGRGSPLERAQLLPPRLTCAEEVAGHGFALPFFIRDLAHLLGFFESGQCEWRQDYEPYERSLKRFGKMIGATTDAYPRLLWEMARRAGLVKRDADNPGFHPHLPEPIGRIELLTALLDALTSRWALDWGPLPFQRVSTKAVRFVHALHLLPADTWVTKESFREVLAFQWPALFREDGVYNEAGEDDALWERAAYLVLETGTSADGREAFRVPGAAQRFLAGEEQAVEDLMPPWEESWIVQADRSVTAPPNLHPTALLELWRMAELESNAGASIFRVTRHSVARALNQGMRSDEALRVLEKRSKTPLPGTVEGVITDEGKRYGRLRVGDATAFIQSDDPALLESVMRQRGLDGLSWRLVAPGVACVEGPPATDLLDMLRKAGHLPVLHSGANSRSARLPQPRRVHAGRRRRKRS